MTKETADVIRRTSRFEAIEKFKHLHATLSLKR